MADSKRTDELVVITKTYDLILWSCNHTGKFPRNHRFVLGERIERNLYDLLETLIRARYTKNRQRLLDDANLASVRRGSLGTRRVAAGVAPVRRGSLTPPFPGPKVSRPHRTDNGTI